MSNDPKDTQPLSHGRKRRNRTYIPAVWDAPGQGTGHPKLSGGVTVDGNGNVITARAFNRADQRYQQSTTVIAANRASRASAESGSTVVLQGANTLIELRAVSGNNYDLLADGTGCDCPDQFRLDESYGPGQQCKHSLIAQLQITSAGGYNNLLWATSKLAEYIGCSERTAEKLCADGVIPASKVHNVWVIVPDTTTMAAINAYIARMIMRGEMPSTEL